MSTRALQMPAVKYSTTSLGGGMTASGASYPGGLDLTTPSLRLQPGALVDCLNFECAPSGGYARIQGYERVDGRAAPSSASYLIVEFASFVNVPAVGNVITQAVSGATGTVCAVVSDMSSYVAVTMTSGSFDFTHAVTIPGPITVGTAVQTIVSIDAKTAAIYTAAAADSYRALIGPVPGSGAILGVVGMIFGGADYAFAFRANAGGTAVNLYKTSAAGWVQVPFFNTVAFTLGSATPVDGDTITQGGVTATIKRVMWQSGTWSGSTAAGVLIVTNPAGGNFAAGAATTTSSGAVTLSGAQVAITMAPGGHFSFVKCNFSGQLETRRIYGCDGVNKCFEFDGGTLAPISTGLSPDHPSNICFHENYLFVSQASSIFACGPGSPYKWTAADGAFEIAIGDVVTSMITLPGSQTTGTLAVYQRNNTSFLYGTDPTSFKLVSFNSGIGALAFSAQNLFDTFVFDDLGVITLQTSLNWGNFLPTTLTKTILPFIQRERDKLVASVLNREKAQYRVFFSDGYGLWLTVFNKQYMGAMPVLFPNPVACCDEGQNSIGMEVAYFGSSDGLGYVYQLDVGTSFDGQPINASFTTAWNPVGSPRVLKRFRAASIEVQGDGYANFQFNYLFGYGSPLVGQPVPVSGTTNFQQMPRWDEFTWDEFTWDGQTLQPSDVDVTGTGENIQVTLASSTNYISTFTINSIIHHYSMRRGMRV